MVFRPGLELLDVGGELISVKEFLRALVRKEIWMWVAWGVFGAEPVELRGFWEILGPWDKVGCFGPKVIWEGQGPEMGEGFFELGLG